MHIYILKDCLRMPKIFKVYIIRNILRILITHKMLCLCIKASIVRSTCSTDYNKTPTNPLETSLICLLDIYRQTMDTNDTFIRVGIQNNSLLEKELHNAEILHCARTLLIEIDNKIQNYFNLEIKIQNYSFKNCVKNIISVYLLCYKRHKSELNIELDLISNTLNTDIRKQKCNRIFYYIEQNRTNLYIIQNLVMMFSKNIQIDRPNIYNVGIYSAFQTRLGKKQQLSNNRSPKSITPYDKLYKMQLKKHKITISHIFKILGKNTSVNSTVSSKLLQQFVKTILQESVLYNYADLHSFTNLVDSELSRHIFSKYFYDKYNSIVDKIYQIHKTMIYFYRFNLGHHIFYEEDVIYLKSLQSDDCEQVDDDCVNFIDKLLILTELYNQDALNKNIKSCNIENNTSTREQKIENAIQTESEKFINVFKINNKVPSYNLENEELQKSFYNSIVSLFVLKFHAYLSMYIEIGKQFIDFCYICIYVHINARTTNILVIENILFMEYYIKSANLSIDNASLVKNIRHYIENDDLNSHITCLFYFLDLIGDFRIKATSLQSMLENIW